MTDKWQCTEHNQEEWYCYKMEEFELHHKRNKEIDDLLSLSNKLSFTPLRCFNCHCHHKNNLTNEIDICPIYGDMNERV